ncbi:MAG: hypothetical protein HQ521_11305 [Bacteroidetes bacterium]|nr:hypothetical protein [Bacteroidota bacterium]
MIEKTRDVLHRGFSPVITNQIKNQGATMFADLTRLATMRRKHKIAINRNTIDQLSYMRMKQYRTKVKIVTVLLILIITSCSSPTDYTQFVNRFIGTGGNGGIVPVAAMPFGMVQLGPDTRTCASGYHFDDKTLLGFSHIHKSGAGCSDFLDILFLPLNINAKADTVNSLSRAQFETSLSHENEDSQPGYYEVGLYDNRVNVELSATLRCGFQRYNYSETGEKSILLDLEHGSDCACTIVTEENVDTILVSSFEMVDDSTIRGSRISSGFAPEQHVYFHTTFSQPIKKCVLYVDNQKADWKNQSH